MDKCVRLVWLRENEGSFRPTLQRGPTITGMFHLIGLLFCSFKA